MEFCGVIAEFNPFHNGHEYFLKEAKRKSGKNILCLMSGNFVQRGEPAITDKFARAKSAICCGADAVFELPEIYACSNAENFANGAIKIFKALGIKTIAFGVENASLETLQKIAKLKAENSEEFKNAFKNEIENGINFNTALKRSIAVTLKDDKISDILNSPNNVLGIEYLTAIIKQEANISPIVIERSDNGFNSNVSKENFLGATAIRNLLLSEKSIDNFVPSNSYLDKIFGHKHLFALETIELTNIRLSEASMLEKHYDYNEGIEFRIKEMADKFCDLNEVTQNVCSARYREPRVKKLLLYPLLGITKEIMALAKSEKPVIKVLAVKKENKSLLSEFDKTKISLIVTNKDIDALETTQKNLYYIDYKASEIYRTILGLKKNDKKMGTVFV